MNFKKNTPLRLTATFILITFIALCVSCAETQKQQSTTYNDEYSWINFEWVGDSIGDRYFDKIAINIPFEIEGIPHKFKSQFDLAAVSTMVYENSIMPYLDKYPNVAKKMDTLIKVNWVKSGEVRAFTSIDFKLDTVLFRNQELVQFDDFGDVLTKDSVATKTVKHIGTIGPNLFRNKYLVIDFPNHRLAVLDSLDKSIKEKTTFVNVKLDKGRIKVPVAINGHVSYFMFDTGASMFPLAVTKEDVKLISNESMANDTIRTSTWGEYYNVHGYRINSNISIGDLKIETKNLNVFDSKKEFKQFFEQEEIMGLMGNSFFLDKKIIIDYQNKKFGIVK